MREKFTLFGTGDQIYPNNMTVDRMKPELEKLQGVWNIVFLEIDGQRLPFGGGRIVVKGDLFTSSGMGATYQGKLTVDTGTEPWAIDMKFTKGPEKGNINRGIFELQGDLWRLCLQMTGHARPTRFATRAGAGIALETLERVTSGPKGNTIISRRKAPTAAGDFPSEPVPELEGQWSMAACSHNGQALKPEFLKWGKRVAKGNETTVFMGKQVILKARYSVDRTQQPNTIDYLLTQGPASGQKQFGIFELQGKSLKVSFAHPGHPRPADFSSTAGDGRTVTTWKRYTVQAKLASVVSLK